MKELLQRLQLTRLSRLLWAWLMFCALAAVLCWALFGWSKLLLLLAVSGLSYCSASFLFYSTEASHWREAVDRCYEELFILALSYEHTPPHLQSLEDFSSKPPIRRVGLPPLPESSTRHQNLYAGKPQPSKMCHKEAQKMIQLIMQHFIHKWYNGITTNTEFPEDVQKLLEHIALEVNVRLKQIDLEEIVCEIATLVLPYLETVNEAGERDFNGVKVFDVTHEKCVLDFESNVKVEHRNLRSRDQELRYYRQALDALIQCAAPSEYAVCDPACMFVREILLTNIIEPLLDLLCDPEFLYESIPIVLSKASKEKVDQELTDIQRENEKLEKQLSRGRLMVKVDGLQRTRFHSFSSNRFGHSFNEGSPGQQAAGQSPPTSKASPMTRPASMAVIPSIQVERIGSPHSWSLGEQDLHGLGTVWNFEPPQNVTTHSVPLTTVSPQVHSSSPHLHHVVPLPASLPPESTAEKGFDVCENYYDDTTNEDMVYVQLAPIYIERHVRVVSEGFSSYIAYVVKFPKRMLTEEELKELNVFDSDSHLEAMKRYSEFRTLHSKLIKSPGLSRHIKGLELPERGRVTSIVSKLPFTSADPDPAFLLERKQGLENYLQSISSVRQIADSDCFHTFLMSGVQSLREANVVSNPKKAKRRSFLGIVRTPTGEVQKAEPIPKHSVESVLSAYLNTHLPLPCCSFHSVHTIRPKRYKPSHLSGELPHTSVLRVHNSRVIGDSQVNVTSSLPTQSFKRTSSTEDPSETVSAAANPDGGGIEEDKEASNIPSVGKPPHTTTTSNTNNVTTATEPESSSCNSDQPVPIQGGTTSDDAKGSEGTGNRNPLVTGIDHRTACKCPPSTPPTGTTEDMSLRLRENVTKKRGGDDRDCEQLFSKATHLNRDTGSKGSRNSSFWMKLGGFVSLVLIYIEWFFSLMYYVVKRGMDPITRFSTIVIVKEQERRAPLSNALFSLGTEVSKKHCPELWVCSEDIQLSLLVAVGGASERFIWKELKDVVYMEENWARALYHLRHTLWPNGELMKKSRRKLSEMERNLVKEKAAEAIKTFLPNFLPYIIGGEEYNGAVVHCLDCLANPRINRHFILRIVEVFLMRLIPEISDKNFKGQLARLRTIKFAHSKSSVSTLHRRATLNKSDTI